MEITSNSRDMYTMICSYIARVSRPSLLRTVSEESISNTVEWYYADLIKTMFHEVVLNGCSELLSYLCACNGISRELEHLQIVSMEPVQRESNADLVPLLLGLLALFRGENRTGRELFKNWRSHLFRVPPTPLNDTYHESIYTALTRIDESLGDLSALSTEDLEALSQKELESEQERILLMKREEELTERARMLEQKEAALRKKEEALHRRENALSAARKNTASASDAPPPSLIEKLNQLASERNSADAALLAQLNQLEAIMRDELRDIMELRNNVQSRTLGDAVTQILALYDLLWEIMCCHPDSDVQRGYETLIESCRELQENILQSLAAFGVSCIDETGVPYDPHLHCLPQDEEPDGDAVVEQIIKPGFSDQSTVLAKAIVQLAEEPFPDEV